MIFYIKVYNQHLDTKIFWEVFGALLPAWQWHLATNGLRPDFEQLQKKVCLFSGHFRAFLAFLLLFEARKAVICTVMWFSRLLAHCWVFQRNSNHLCTLVVIFDTTFFSHLSIWNLAKCTVYSWHGRSNRLAKGSNLKFFCWKTLEKSWVILICI